MCTVGLPYTQHSRGVKSSFKSSVRRHSRGVLRLTEHEREGKSPALHQGRFDKKNRCPRAGGQQQPFKSNILSVISWLRKHWIGIGFLGSYESHEEICQFLEGRKQKCRISVSTLSNALSILCSWVNFTSCPGVFFPLVFIVCYVP